MGWVGRERLFSFGLWRHFLRQTFMDANSIPLTYTCLDPFGRKWTTRALPLTPPLWKRPLQPRYCRLEIGRKHPPVLVSRMGSPCDSFFLFLICFPCLSCFVGQQEAKKRPGSSRFGGGGGDGAGPSTGAAGGDEAPEVAAPKRDVSLIDMKRANNVGILLARYKVRGARE